MQRPPQTLRHREHECADIVPGAELRKLAKFCPVRVSGRLSDEDTAVLVMILPDICGELIGLRRSLAMPASTFAVSNTVLRQLARDSPRRHLGELTDREHLSLSARLPGICRELLTLRSLETARAA